MRNRAILLIAVMLAACSSQSGTQPMPKPQPTAQALLKTPQIPPVEFGKRKPGTRITSENMPYFDTVKYCTWANRREKIFRGPRYEQCIADQRGTRHVMAKAIDARKFKDAKIIHCAKATRTAYDGMWLCLWDQPFQ